MLWMLLACGQANECDKAGAYLNVVDGDGNTEADLDLEHENKVHGTSYEASDCSNADSTAEWKAVCGQYADAYDTYQTCVDECTLSTSDAYTACHDGCLDADYPSESMSADLQACWQTCPDQPTWTCD